MELQNLPLSKNSGTATEKILGFEWNDFFPIQVSDEISITTATYGEVGRFAKKYPLQHPGDSRFLAENCLARDRFYLIFADFFKFSLEGQLAGVLVGTLADWSTYYIRYVQISPELRGEGLYQNLVQRLIQILGNHGVNRIEVDVSPTNLVHVHVLNKLGFNAVGLSATDRWGMLVKYSKFINSESQNVFTNQFCLNLRPQTEEDLKKAKGVLS